MPSASENHQWQAYVQPETAIKSLIEEKEYRCPCCDNRFTERHVCVEKLELKGVDTDFRMIYSPIDPTLYGIVRCESCGYASLDKTFHNLSFTKSQIIMSMLPSAYKNLGSPKIYTEDIAIKRYEAAIMTALLTREKSSEIAYLYMNLAWIYRSKGDVVSEKKMIKASFEGFLDAVQNEYFPLIDLSKQKTLYIMGDFLYRFSKDDQARSFFMKALKVHDTSGRIKQKIEEHPLMNG